MTPCPLTETDNPSRASDTDGATLQEIAETLRLTNEGARQALTMAVRKLWRRKP